MIDDDGIHITDHEAVTPLFGIFRPYLIARGFVA
jgi:hypothetical protein